MYVQHAARNVLSSPKLFRHTEIRGKIMHIRACTIYLDKKLKLLTTCLSLIFAEFLHCFLKGCRQTAHMTLLTINPAIPLQPSLCNVLVFLFRTQEQGGRFKGILLIYRLVRAVGERLGAGRRELWSQAGADSGEDWWLMTQVQENKCK